ncbi:cupin [Sphingobacteriaceae bacterium]|nr:cupin [Sphingobacteriaceae bacterium]
MERAAQKLFVEYSHVIDDNGIFPNSHLPVLIYKDVLDFPLFFDAVYITHLFEKNNWTNSWKAGIFTYHHYHSNAHEVIGVYKGKTELMLGGENGLKVMLEKGDVIIIPAGVAHKNLGDENAVACVGAYADGATYDICTGKKGERPLADTNLLTLALPDRDPVLGLKGGVEKYWR